MENEVKEDEVVMGKSHGWNNTSGEKVEPALPGTDRELIQRATSPLCCNRALMFIHFGITAKRSTEVCLQKFPNSHNGMRAKDTIIIQGGSQVQALRGLLI